MITGILVAMASLGQWFRVTHKLGTEGLVERKMGAWGERE